jgi:hypothetical protein
VAAEVTDEVKMGYKAHSARHVPGVSTDRGKPTSFNVMVIVEYESVRVIWNGASINRGVSVVLTCGLQRIYGVGNSTRFQRSCCD